MVAIPISYDQPGVAARIAYHGVGEVLGLGDLTAESHSELIHRVLSDSSYRESALYFQWIIDETQGLDVAADAIERVLGDTRLLNSPMNRVNGRQRRCLRSSANDLLKFLAANLGYPTSPLTPAMTAMLKVRRSTGRPGLGLEVAFAWHIFTSRGKEIIWHDATAAPADSVLSSALI